MYYSLGVDFQKYKQPFIISEKVSLKVYAVKDGVKSKTITTDFYKIDPNLKIDLQTEYANQYNAGGDTALIDGVLGTEDFRTGTWQGYFDVDLIAVVDLGKIKSISEISINSLQNQRSWIFLPTEIDFLVSENGIDFKLISKRKFGKVMPNENVKIEASKVRFKTKKVRYIKIIAKKLGKLPEWHLGYQHDGRSWLFVDEIQIK
jgi:hypothetical protein